MANLAAELGPEGSPTWLPRQFTGRSLLGPAVVGGAATALHNPLAAVPLAAVASPKVASQVVLPVTQFGENVAANIGDALNKPITLGNNLGKTLGNERGSLGNLDNIVNKDDAQKLADEYGIKFNGIQEGAGSIQPTALFTDPETHNTIAARNMAEFIKKMKEQKGR